MRTAACVFAAFLCLPQAPAWAQSAADCTQTMRQADALVAAVERDARAYWSYRATYVGLMYDASNAKGPDASKRADTAKSLAAPIQARASTSYANMRALIETAKKQGCAPKDKLAALLKSAFDSTHAVRIDRFPVEENIESADVVSNKLLPTPKAR